ncbi:MAG: T9SS type A sorting domain-containing protein [Chlorobi bacterium]|nr:T9SS type A sorting domain-containing protein [Chlorobiota bacterium]
MKSLLIIFLSLTVVSIKAQNSLNIFYYPLNNIYSSLVPDESGNFNRGIAYNTMPARDRFEQQDKALYFNGSAYIKLDAGKYAFDEYSYSMWVKIIDQPYPGTAGFIFDIGSDYGVDQYLAYTNEYSNYSFNGFLGQGYNTNLSASWISQRDLVADNQWHFLVYTRSSNKLKLYFDANIIDSLNVDDLLPIYGEDIKGYIGCRNNLTQFFTGYIDDIRLYNYPIDKSLIDSLFVSFPLSISSVSELSFYAYPIPTRNKLNLVLNSNIKEFTASIYSVLGNKLLSFTNTKSINIETLTEGMYILKLHEKNGKKDKSILIIKK